jgi:hypothetical protein
MTEEMSRAIEQNDADHKNGLCFGNDLYPGTEKFKPKEAEGGEVGQLCGLASKGNPDIKCRLDAGHYQEYHSNGRMDWIECEPASVEPKEAAPTKLEQEDK